MTSMLTVKYMHNWLITNASHVFIDGIFSSLPFSLSKCFLQHYARCVSFIVINIYFVSFSLQYSFNSLCVIAYTKCKYLTEFAFVTLFFVHSFSFVAYQLILVYTYIMCEIPQNLAKVVFISYTYTICFIDAINVGWEKKHTEEWGKEWVSMMRQSE